MNPAVHPKKHTLRQLRIDTSLKMIEAIGLDNFETFGDCLARNQKMVARLQRARKFDKIREKIDAPTVYRYEYGWDGDWLASRAYRARIIPQAYRILDQHPGPLYFASIAHPNWETAEEKLNSVKMAAAKQWLHRRLDKLEGDVVVVGGFECSLRIDPEVTPYWAGHFHLVVAGASKDDLMTALAIERHYIRRYARPLVIDPIGDLAARLAYSTKRVVKQSIAYRGRNGRQQRRELPLAAGHQTELDLWLLGLRAGERTFLYGCRHHHGTLSQIGTGDITKMAQTAT